MQAASLSSGTTRHYPAALVLAAITMMVAAMFPIGPVGAQSAPT